MSAGQPARRYRAIFMEMFGILASGSTDDEAHTMLMESLLERYRIRTDPETLRARFDEKLNGPHGGARAGWVHHRDIAQKAFCTILEGLGRRTGPQDRGWFAEEYIRVHQSFVRLLPGAREMLGELAGSGLHVGLIEDCDTRYLDRMLCWLDIVPFFGSRTTSGEVGADPTGCEPRQAIFAGGCVGRGIGPAKDAGMTTVLLDAGMSEGELDAVDFVASSPARLVKILVELAYTGVPAG